MKEWIDKYAQGFSLVSEAIAGLPAEVVRFKPSAAEWSIHEIIVHLADAEIVGLHRMKQILAERNPLLTAFDQDRWTSCNHYDACDGQEHLALFKLLRASFLPVLREIGDAEWERTGVHNEVGKVTLKDVLESYVQHVDDHVRQIKRNIAAYHRRG